MVIDFYIESQKQIMKAIDERNKGKKKFYFRNKEGNKKKSRKN